MFNPGVLLEFPLQSLRKVGLLNEKKISRAAGLSTYLILLTMCAALILMLTQFFYINGDVTGYVRTFEGAAGYIQIILKWSICFYNKHKYLNLVKILQKFRSEDQYSATTQKDVMIISKRILLLQKLFSYAIRIAIYFIMIPYSIMKKELAFGDWYMEKNGMFALAWIAVIITLVMFSFFIGYYDCLYFGFCYELQIQCKILFSRLEELNVDELNSESDIENYYQKFQTYLRHHMLLLEFHSELQNVYSVTLLIQYVTAAPILCVEMYALSETDDTMLIMRYSISLVCVLFQVASYCIPANHVEQEMSTISMAIYNSDWYSKYFPKIRIPVILMIQRAQQKQTLTACGLIEMNIDTLGKLIKFALTLCIALKSFKSLN